MEVITKIITYNDITDGIPVINGDSYGLASKLTAQRRNTLLANPNQVDRNACAMQLKLIDDEIVGRSMQFYTRFKAIDDIFECVSGSTLDVPEQFRHYAIGAELMMYPVYKMPGDFVIVAGISSIALPLYKKLKYSIFEFPRLLLVINSKPILNSKGLGFFAPLVNLAFKTWRAISCFKPDSGYIIEKVQMVPDWVGELATNDGHKFMENHNKEWLQWNLDYNFKGDKDDSQSLYIIKDGTEKLGFVMIKERWRENAGGLKNLILGSIVEWGSYDETRLSESDLIDIAIPLFSSKVDLIEFASTDLKTVKNMRKKGFLPFGKAHVAFKDKKRKYPEAKDPDNWRLRLGYADVILT